MLKFENKINVGGGREEKRECGFCQCCLMPMLSRMAFLRCWFVYHLDLKTMSNCSGLVIKECVSHSLWKPRESKTGIIFLLLIQSDSGILLNMVFVWYYCSFVCFLMSIAESITNVPFFPPIEPFYHPLPRLSSNYNVSIGYAYMHPSSLLISSHPPPPCLWDLTVCPILLRLWIYLFIRLFLFFRFHIGVTSCDTCLSLTAIFILA